MKLAELFGKGKTVFSCEVFPPKRDTPVDSIYTTLDGLKDIRPDFISVTYGAGGSKVNQTTREIASIIENRYHIPAMAHLTCVAAGKEDVDQLLADLKADGVENILALRGDVNPDYPPKTDLPTPAIWSPTFTPGATSAFPPPAIRRGTWKAPTWSATSAT